MLNFGDVCIYIYPIVFKVSWLITIHSKCFHRIYVVYKCTWNNTHTIDFWSTTNCRWNAEQLMVNLPLRLFPPLLLSERQRQNALPQEINTYHIQIRQISVNKKHFSYAWGVYPYSSDTGWCSTPTLFLICSSFSRENGHPLLICSSLSTAQDMIGEYKKNTSTSSLRNMMEVIWFCLYLQHDDHETHRCHKRVWGSLERNPALTWMRNVENWSTSLGWQTGFCGSRL